MEAELFGGVALPVDLPAAALQHAPDVRPFDQLANLLQAHLQLPPGPLERAHRRSQLGLDALAIEATREDLSDQPNTFHARNSRMAPIASTQTCRPPTTIGTVRFDFRPVRWTISFSCPAASGRSSGKRSKRSVSPRKTVAWYQGVIRLHVLREIGREPGAGPRGDVCEARPVGRERGERAAVSTEELHEQAQPALDLRADLLDRQAGEASREVGEEVLEPTALVGGHGERSVSRRGADACGLTVLTAPYDGWNCPIVPPTRDPAPILRNMADETVDQRRELGARATATTTCPAR
jgi:hypothetical protein